MVEPPQAGFYPGLPLLQNTDVVLASASPRRRELLARLLPASAFKVLPLDIDESEQPGEAPASYVERLALEKARAGAAALQKRGLFENRPTLLIGSDTTVTLDGKIYGKPADKADAATMLRALSGRTHQVITGVAVVLLAATGQIEKELSLADTSDVTFRTLSDAEIAWYIATDEPMDKAGAYAVQGFGGALISAVRGDFYTIVGLPLSPLIGLLRQL